MENEVLLRQVLLLGDVLFVSEVKSVGMLGDNP